jgi:DNA-binding transcriptional ArsR family regulator
MKYSKPELYKKLILKNLRESKRTIEVLLEKVNEILYSDFNMKTIERRTLDRALKDLRKDGFNITSKNINGVFYYILDESSNSEQLTEEEQLTFPLLLGLLDTEKNMKAVEWMKTVLTDEFNFSSEDLKTHPYFVNVQPTLNNQDKLLILAGKIIDFMKKGKAIQFLYNKSGVEELKQVAPLQIRYYDNRYYMIGSSIDDQTNKPTNLLQTFTLDMFIEGQVYPAVEEAEDVNIEERHIYFDYDDLYKKTNFDGFLKNSLGIWYNWKVNILKTFRLKFTGWAIGIIRNKKIHLSQKTI